jgi:PKD repeat protein
MQNKWLEEHPDYKAIYIAEQQKAKTLDSISFLTKHLVNKATTTTYTIPVVFHILHLNGPENISDAQVMDAVAILNRDFRKLNPDTASIHPSFKSLAADVNFEFALASLDPSGNCTSGIVRHYDTRTNWESDPADYLYTWPRSKYMNIYVVKTISSGAAGYTYLPGTVPANMDAIVILQDYVGSIGTGNPYTSRALTHEVGHWFNLQHVWGMTNQPGVSCGDDGVSDTPVTKGFPWCANTAPSSCNPPIIENIQNYMDYAYCSKMFTTGQATRMTNALLSSGGQRSNLSTPSNLSATGVDFPVGPCAPIADFVAQNTVGCIGANFNFTDISYNGTATGWEWYFANGSPSTSTVQNASASFTSSGLKTVSLKASNAYGADSVGKTLVTVLAGPGSGTASVLQSFESINFPDSNWINNPPQTGSGWTQISGAGATGNKCLFVNNYFDTPNQSVRFFSPMFYLGYLTAPALSFKVAYSTKAGGCNDRMRVFASSDCAVTWTALYSKSDTALHTFNTATFVAGGAFTNPTAAQWRNEVINLGMFPISSNLLFKFEFTPDSTNPGNNIFIDDINVGSTTGISSVQKENVNWSVFPNPANENINIEFFLNEAQSITIDMIDVTGKVVKSYSINRANAGIHKEIINLNSYSRGLYFIKLSGTSITSVKKLVLE